jgi:hypothetical protein
LRVVEPQKRQLILETKRATVWNSSSTVARSLEQKTSGQQDADDYEDCDDDDFNKAHDRLTSSLKRC